MKPQQIEDQRYQKSDHCEINFEEKLMLQMLKQHTVLLKKEEGGIKILDIGCGSGLITREIRKKGYAVEGIDFSEEAVKKAIQNGVDASICDLDGGINKPSEDYDVVWAGDIIEHVFDPIGLLRESNRVLKKGGILIMCIPSDVGIISRIRMLLGYSYQEAVYKKAGYYKHHTFFNLRLALFMLKEAKFKIQEIKKVLLLNKRRYSIRLLPSAFYNELVIKAQKK